MPQSSPPEWPRAEPEILPPERRDPRNMRDVPPHWSAGAGGAHVRGTYRVRVVKLGPFGAGLLALGIAAASAALFVVMLGTLLVLIPVIGLIVAAVIIAALVRGTFR
jgi:hypothetical protein